MGDIVRGGVEVIPAVDSRVSVWLGVVDHCYILSDEKIHRYIVGELQVYLVSVSHGCLHVYMI